MAVALEDSVTSGTFSSPLGTIPWPLGAPADGDILVAMVQGNDNGTITPPSGWSQLYFESHVSPAYNTSGLYWHRASSEPSSLTWGDSLTGVNFVVSMLRISGAAVTAPQWSHSASATTSVATNPLTSAAANALVIAGFEGANSTTALSVSSNPACTQITAGGSSGTGFRSLFVRRTTLASNGESGITISSTASGTTGSMHAFLLIFAPSGALDQVNVTDTRSAFNDAPVIAHIARISPSDTRSATSDLPTVARTANLATSDTRAATSDSAGALHVSLLAPSDTRSATSDSAEFLAFRLPAPPADIRQSISDTPNLYRSQAGTTTLNYKQTVLVDNPSVFYQLND
jgi:hypothetical protein